MAYNSCKHFKYSSRKNGNIIEKKLVHEIYNMLHLYTQYYLHVILHNSFIISQRNRYFSEKIY